MKHKFNIVKSSLLFFALFFVLGASAAGAATLYFSPSSGNFSVGNIFTASLLTNTQGQAINNAEAILNFPTEYMEVVSVSKFGSIFSLWVLEPSFSNSAGTISFNGGLPTPGFTGSSGKIINVVFRAKKAGPGSLISTSAAVRANDGYGTDVLTNAPQASFIFITEDAPAPPATEKPIIRYPSGAPGAPKITSSTHSDPDSWYSNSTATFNWSLTEDITANKLLLGKLPVADPIVLYEPPVSEKIITEIEDGIWYFHANLRNDSGFGPTGHFKFQIDTKKPDRFDITEIPRADLTDPVASFEFIAEDQTSGIDYYEIRIDNGSLETWKDDGSHTYKTPVIIYGTHVLTVKAVDRAGNFLLNSTEFNIEALNSPILSEYPAEMKSGEIMVVRGETYPGSEVAIWVQKDKEEPRRFVLNSDPEGQIIFIMENGVEVGVYKLWAEVMDDRGAKSAPSEKITIAVRQLAILRIGSLAISLLSVLVPLIALLILLLLLMLLAYRKYREHKKKLRKEVREAEDVLHKAFDLLRKDVRSNIKLLESAKNKRQLTREEDKIIEELKKNLDSAEQIISKEVEDIEKEIK